MSPASLAKTRRDKYEEHRLAEACSHIARARQILSSTFSGITPLMEAKQVLRTMEHVIAATRDPMLEKDAASFFDYVSNEVAAVGDEHYWSRVYMTTLRRALARWEFDKGTTPAQAHEVLLRVEAEPDSRMRYVEAEKRLREIVDSVLLPLRQVG